MIPQMKNKRWRVLLIPVMVLSAWFLSKGTAQNPSGKGFTPHGSQVIRVPRPEELGRVMPGKPISPADQRQSASSVSNSADSKRSNAGHSNGSLVPSAQELRQLQKEGGVIY